MGVIWNPDKISYMLDTNIIEFYEFEISGGWGGKGAPPGGGDRCTSVRIIFRNSKPLPTLLSKKMA